MLWIGFKKQLFESRGKLVTVIYRDGILYYIYLLRALILSTRELTEADYCEVSICTGEFDYVFGCNGKLQ